MTVQRLPQSFPSSPNPSNAPANIVDGVAALAANTPQWSLGAALVRPALSGGPSMSETWHLEAIAIQAYVGLEIAQAGQFGKLGKIMAGVMVGSAAIATTRSADGSPWVPSYASSPLLDPTLAATLWDPAQDSLPPNASLSAANPGNTLLVSATILPPVPIEINYGTNVYIGLWQLPSLLGLAAAGSIYRYLAFASYTISYDDGESVPPGGYS